MPGMYATQELEVTAAKIVHFDQLEAIPNYALRLNAAWNRTYGHAARGTLVYVTDPATLTVTPIALGTVVAVNGNAVTLARGAAVDQTRLNGKTLTKIAADGTITDLPVTVQSVAGQPGSAQFLPQFEDVTVTFSGAHGLIAGDVIGSEGLTAQKIKDSFDGMIYESKNSDQDIQVSVAVEIKARTALSIGAGAIAKIIPDRVRVRDDITFVAAL